MRVSLQNLHCKKFKFTTYVFTQRSVGDYSSYLLELIYNRSAPYVKNYICKAECIYLKFYL